MLRKQSDETDPADWFYLAADRLNAADLIYRAEGLTPSGVELLQEAAERYLKGYLVGQGWRLIKTHDLGELIGEAGRFDPRFSQFEDFAEKLTEDFFATHYPGQDWSLVGQHYDDLRRQLGEILELIRQSLPRFFPSPPN